MAVNKHIAILGSTGSIGTQALDIVRENPDFCIDVLTANNNADLLIQQAVEFKPSVVVISNKNLEYKVKNALSGYNIQVLSGEEAISEVVTIDSINIVLTSMVGYSGLIPTLKAIESGKDIALANKETLVVAGDLIMSSAKRKGISILPVDSEHSAIFQCFNGENKNSAERIILTASGGPFRNKTEEELKQVTCADALKHPNWNMGAKVTIDSASLMNKGLEKIEAFWLFGISPDNIEIVIHPQSIIHSMVEFRDGSVIAQLSPPDMRLPILYAFGYPERKSSSLPRLDFTCCPPLTFEKPDRKKFPNLALAEDALKKGGNMPCIMNSANEVAVKAFLEGRISFTAMPVIIEKTMESISFVSSPSLEDYMQTHHEAGQTATHIIKHL